MIFIELQKKANALYPALMLESLVSRSVRLRARYICFWFLIMVALVVAIGSFSSHISFIPENLVLSYTAAKSNFHGLLFLIFCLWIISYLLEAMYLSYYFKLASIDFEVAQVVVKTKDDITKAFLNSKIGALTMLRLGISPEEVQNFLQTRQDIVRPNEYVTPADVDEDQFVSLAEFGSTLMHFDSDLAKFLQKYEVTLDTFVSALEWMSSSQIQIRRKSEWWSRKRLARIPSIGRNWSYGQIYLLEKFAHDIADENLYQNLGRKGKVYKEIVEKIERVLVSNTGANVMLISDNALVAKEVTCTLAKMIADGTAFPELEKKRVYVLDGVALIDTMKEKVAFETALQHILSQTSKSGNVILVLERLAQFAESVHALGVDISEILSSALKSTNLRVIAIADKDGFHGSIEMNRALMENFERVFIEDIPVASALSMVEDEVNVAEQIHGVFFTYQSLSTIVDAVGRYFPEESLADKSRDLLYEVAAEVSEENKAIVTKDLVLKTIQSKTGIPLGTVSSEEESNLEHLEEKLHERIVGQNQAIKILSDSLKRARLGITNSKRPQGSFLFLGPTGVGKTETAKALAQKYFEREENMVRLDMSEYIGDDAVEKLIGSHDKNVQGILSSVIREKKYGVLLLDEFEKTSVEVHNLFLQILDEGIFRDGYGHEVNLRNYIIIATSNAGSDFMGEAISAGEDIVKEKGNITNYLIQHHIFKPELINRFDNVVIFHPLGNAHLKNIAEKMIEELNNRLEDKGISVKFNQDLIEYLVKNSQNSRFGAREMNRIIQEKVETKIAEGMIGGSIKSGDTVSFEKNEVEGGEIHLRVI